jgi:uncharacterized protein (TIGR03437 family)
VQVRRVWAFSPNRLRANVWVAPNIAAATVNATVINGFQIVAQPFPIQALPQNPRLPVLNPALTNALPPLSGAFPGATVILTGANLEGGAITIAGRPAAIVSAAANQITFAVPSDVAPGPAVLSFSNGTDTVAVIVTIDALPPEIRASSVESFQVGAVSAVRAGATVVLAVANLGEAPPDSSRVRVVIGGVEHPALSITPDGPTYQIRVVLEASVPTGLAPVTVLLDGRSSAPFAIAVAP